MLLDITKPKTGNALVITDPTGGMHACASADDLWSTLDKILADPEMPPRERPAPARNRGEDQGEDDIMAEVGGRIANSILDGLRSMSYRGKDRGKKPPKGEDDV